MPAVEEKYVGAWKTLEQRVNSGLVSSRGGRGRGEGPLPRPRRRGKATSTTNANTSVTDSNTTNDTDGGTIAHRDGDRSHPPHPNPTPPEGRARYGEEDGGGGDLIVESLGVVEEAVIIPKAPTIALDIHARARNRRSGSATATMVPNLLSDHPPIIIIDDKNDNKNDNDVVVPTKTKEKETKTTREKVRPKLTPVIDYNPSSNEEEDEYASWTSPPPEQSSNPVLVMSPVLHGDVVSVIVDVDSAAAVDASQQPTSVSGKDVDMSSSVASCPTTMNTLSSDTFEFCHPAEELVHTHPPPPSNDRRSLLSTDTHESLKDEFLTKISSENDMISPTFVEKKVMIVDHQSEKENEIIELPFQVKTSNDNDCCSRCVIA